MRRRFRRILPLPTDAETAFAWHARPGAFDRLVPPWRDIRVIEQRGGIEEGAELIFRAGMGPVGVRWHAVHEDYVPGRQFVDVQASGPFAYWRHVHRFETEAGEASLVDDIEYALPGGVLGQRVGGSFAERDLERMFAYRHATTRADLALHARYDATPRSRIVICHSHGGHPLLATVTAMLTTGGHTVTTVEGPSAVADALAIPLEDPARLATPDVVIMLGMPVGSVASRVKQKRDDRPWTLISFQGYDDSLNQSVADGETFKGAETSSMSEPVSDTASETVRTVDLRAGTILAPGEDAFDRSVSRARVGLMMTLSNQNDRAWISRDDAAAAIVHGACDQTVRGAFTLAAEGTVTPRTLARAAWDGTGSRAPGARAVDARALRRASSVAAPAGFPALRHPTLDTAFRYLLGQEAVANQATQGADSADNTNEKGAAT